MPIVPTANPAADKKAAAAKAAATKKAAAAKAAATKKAAAAKAAASKKAALKNKYKVLIPFRLGFDEVKKGDIVDLHESTAMRMLANGFVKKAK